MAGLLPRALWSPSTPSQLEDPSVLGIPKTTTPKKHFLSSFFNFLNVSTKNWYQKSQPQDDLFVRQHLATRALLDLVTDSCLHSHPLHLYHVTYLKPLTFHSL